MHHLRYFLCSILVFLFISSKAQIYAPCDKQATLETCWLYSSMQRLQGAGVMFGHHDDTAYGIGWSAEPDHSDVKSAAGIYPAVYGWDLAKMEHDSPKDINSIPFKLQRKLVQQAYARGGINTFCWHLDNPVDGKSAWDTTQRIVAQIIPGGAYHEAYKVYLDRIAGYIKTLKGSEGEAIPILFRPFHELTGTWFWWCRNKCTPDEFKTLWRFTIDYLRNEKKLHNLLIVYSVADFDTKEQFLERYPGDEYADFVGFDNYCYKSIPAYQNNLYKRLTLQQKIADEHHKVSCLAETGYETTILQPVLEKNYRTSYVLAWRNGRDNNHYYVPFKGQVSEADFKKFSQSPITMFQNRITSLAVYGKYIPPDVK
jgi:mannan endo-1,4-beta-mannosidase